MSKDITPGAQNELDAAKASYEAHKAQSNVLGVGDGSGDATHTTNMIAAQRSANRVWGTEPQPAGDE